MADRQAQATPFKLSSYDEAAILEGCGYKRRRTHAGLSYVMGGEGPLLVLMHGGSGSWNHWLFNLSSLARYFRVAALDLPGFGASALAAPEIENADYLALVTRAVLDIATAGEPIGLSGFSFGSIVAAEVAGQIGARVNSLSLIGPAGFTAPVGRLATPYGRKTLRQRLGREPDMAELREMHRNNLSEIMLSVPAAVDDPIVDLHIANVDHTRYNSRRISWSGAMLELLAQLQQPILVVYGERDHTQAPTIASRVAEMKVVRPDLQVLSLAGCGHWAMYEASAVVDEALIAFHRRG